MRETSRDLSHLVVPLVASLLVAVVGACGPDGRTDDDPGGGDAGGPCSPGETTCAGSSYQTCMDGKFVTTTECPQACAPQLGCVACVPGSGSCSGTTSSVCRQDGSGYDDFPCDPLLGNVCEPGSGQCVGECSPAALGRSYIGCEYYATVTGNPVGNTFDFAVAIANTSNQDAMVTIEDGALAAPRMVVVPAQSVRVEQLPWVDALKLCSAPNPDNCYVFPAKAALVANGAYHIRSTRPVTVYQFNPLQYTEAGTNSYSNDASLLLPTNVWGTSYLAAGWPRLDANPGAGQTWPSLLAVTAAQDNTQVTINPKFATLAYGGAPAFPANTPTTVTLNSGDVIEIAAFGSIGAMPFDDLTGSAISSDKPVQVISGHYCAYIPTPDFGYCDHLEESMFPTDTLGTTYLVTAPIMQSLPSGKEQVVRIIAAASNVTLTYDPPQANAPTTITNVGDYVEIARTVNNFQVTADKKVIVVQYMEGSTAGGGSGDPAMTLSAPIEQYRQEYLFHAPTNYQTNYVNITAPTGTNVMLDGQAVAGFTAIGGSGFGVARVPLPNNVDGNHVLTADKPVGIAVYGYGMDTSYSYPGGLDFTIID